MPSCLNSTDHERYPHFEDYEKGTNEEQYLTSTRAKSRIKASSKNAYYGSCMFRYICKGVGRNRPHNSVLSLAVKESSTIK